MKKVFNLFLAASLALCLISCGSKPAPEETETPAAPEVTESTEEVTQKVDNSAEDEAAKKAAEEEAARKAAEEEAARKAAEEEAARKAQEYEEARKNAKAEREVAVEAKKNADSVKAGVARNEEYVAAVDDFKKGDSHFVTKNPQAAYDCYKSSKEQFIALYDELYGERAEALAALEAAKKAVEASAQFAEEADEIAPITQELDGIEEEDTILLEEDEYEDPEAFEEEIPETLEEVE